MQALRRLERRHLCWWRVGWGSGWATQASSWRCHRTPHEAPASSRWGDASACCTSQPKGTPKFNNISTAAVHPDHPSNTGRTAGFRQGSVRPVPLAVLHQRLSKHFLSLQLCNENILAMNAKAHTSAMALGALH